MFFVNSFNLKKAISAEHVVDTHVINNIHLPPDSCVRQLIKST